MNALEMKNSILSVINGIDRDDAVFWSKLERAVKRVLNDEHKISHKDAITPFVASMKTGVKLPDDLDIKALRDEHYLRKYE